MVARRLEKADREGLLQGYDLGLSLQDKGKGFYIVTATPFETAAEIAPGFNLLFADETTLKTVIRVSIRGIPASAQRYSVMAQWSGRNIPDKTEFDW
ncbi:MAG: hypothetical protein MZV63_13880 [Marinilabiliales bacterium]|nr:hypothetical protein [Marinilabiliales bacterium]